MIFKDDGTTRTAWARILGIVLAILGAAQSSLGFLQYEGNEVLTLIVPIAGVFVALALPASQLAQSVKERFLDDAERLIREEFEDIENVGHTLESLLRVHRRNLESMKRVIYFSLASFLVGLLGLFGAFKHVSLYDNFTLVNFIACLSTVFLILAVFWLLPVVASSFDLKDIDRLLESFKKTAKPNAAATRVEPGDNEDPDREASADKPQS